MFVSVLIIDRLMVFVLERERAQKDYGGFLMFVVHDFNYALDGTVLAKPFFLFTFALKNVKKHIIASFLIRLLLRRRWQGAHCHIPG